MIVKETCRKMSTLWASRGVGRLCRCLQVLFMDLGSVPSCEASLQHRFLLWWFYRTCSVISVSSSLLEKQQRGKDLMIKLQRNKKLKICTLQSVCTFFCQLVLGLFLWGSWMETELQSYRQRWRRFWFFSRCVSFLCLGVWCRMRFQT